MDKQDRLRVFEDFLQEEGYSPKRDGDGDIVFKREGRTYLILLDDDDEFFRIVFPSFWSIESPQELLQVQAAAVKATEAIKVAKIFPVKDDTWGSIEIFCSSIDEAKKVFPRSMSALHAAVDRFAQEMRA